MSELQSISDIFQKKLFRIPDYQRGYAWKKEQLVDFWDDIINLHNNKYHYTGLLSIKSIEDNITCSWINENWLFKKGYKAYHIVDGQQRLTTFAILMNEIVDLISNLDENKDKKEDEITFMFESLSEIRKMYISQVRPPEKIITTYLFGYETDNPSEKYLKHEVFNEPYGGTIDETYYTKNLKFAKEFFKNNLKNLYNDSGYVSIEMLYTKLTQQMMFNIHEIDDDYDVFVAFETMNNRGKKLTNLELLKNRLIYLTTLYDDSYFDSDNKSELRKNINDTWKEVYYQLGRNTKTPLSDDEFLRAHWSIYFQYTRRKGDDYIKFLLDKFSNRNIFSQKHMTMNVISEDEEMQIPDNLDEDVESIEYISNISDLNESYFLEPNEIKKYVDNLKEMAKYWYYSFFPQEIQELSRNEILWLDRLNRVGINYFRPLVTASMIPSVKSTAENRVELFKSIEKFIFLCFRMAMYQASYRSSYYYRKARELYFGGDIIKLIKDLNDAFSINTDEAINGFINKTSLRFKNGQGFYAWRDLKYFLYEYEYYLGEKNNLEKVNWLMFTRVEKDKVTIEHILPQTPTKWYWRNQFRDYTKDEVKILSSSLGNLLPLSKSINSKLQNIGFDEKKITQPNGRRGYENGSHSEIEVSKALEWNASEILTRGLHLLDFMEMRWGISFVDDEQKLKLLHLDFIKDYREELPEIPKLVQKGKTIIDKKFKIEISTLQLEFWSKFVAYCKTIGRNDIASRKPYAENWYDIGIGKSGYYLFLQVLKNNVLRVGIYITNFETFKRLEYYKDLIESDCSFKMDWYSSRKSSKAKRVLYSKNTDIYDIDKYIEYFDWLISTSDKLKSALLKNDINM